MRQRQLLVRALDPGFGVVLIHSVIGCPLSLPRVGSVKFHVFQADRFRELLHRLSGWQDRLQVVQFALVKAIGKLDVDFDVEVARFVVSLRGHALTMDDLQVTIVDDLAGEDINNKSTIVEVADGKGTASEGRQKVDLYLADQVVFLPLESFVGLLLNHDDHVSWGYARGLVTLATESNRLAALHTLVDVYLQRLLF